MCKIYVKNKQCTNCEYFIPYKNNRNNKINSLGLCDMFGGNIFAEHCRLNEKLCGKNATFYEETKNNTKENTKENIVQMTEDEMKILINDYYKFLRNENDW